MVCFTFSEQNLFQQRTGVLGKVQSAPLGGQDAGTRPSRAAVKETRNPFPGSAASAVPEVAARRVFGLTSSDKPCILAGAIAYDV